MKIPREFTPLHLLTILTELGPARQLGRAERLELRPWLGDFSVEVRRFFE